jgi:hypothetical protein
MTSAITLLKRAICLQQRFAIASPIKQGEKIMAQTRLWELSEVIGELENAITLIQYDETLTDEEREKQLEKAF